MQSNRYIWKPLKIGQSFPTIFQFGNFSKIAEDSWLLPDDIPKFKLWSFECCRSFSEIVRRFPRYVSITWCFDYIPNTFQTQPNSHQQLNLPYPSFPTAVPHLITSIWPSLGGGGGGRGEGRGFLSFLHSCSPPSPRKRDNQVTHAKDLPNHWIQPMNNKRYATALQLSDCL